MTGKYYGEIHGLGVTLQVNEATKFCSRNNKNEDYIRIDTKKARTLFKSGL
jgi:hypothetical protein